MEYEPLAVNATEARNNASKLAMCIRDNEDAHVGEALPTTAYCGMCGRNASSEGLMMVYVHDNHIIPIGTDVCRQYFLERLAYHREREVRANHPEKSRRLARIDLAIQRAGD